MFGLVLCSLSKHLHILLEQNQHSTSFNTSYEVRNLKENPAVIAVHR